MRRDPIFLHAGIIARDLRLQPGTDPLESIIRHCDRQVRAFLKGLPCATLPALLDLVANKLGTRFVEVHDDEQLDQVTDEFRRRRESGFAQLREQLTPDVFGVTIRLQQPRPGELRFVSIIDCRGDKAARRYFTKWHEVAHLFVLTDQARLQLFRTHEIVKTPEEKIIDKIAGHYSLYQPFIASHLRGKLTFARIEDIRRACCPESSRQAAAIGVVAAWPEPVIFLRAKTALKRAEQRHHDAGQRTFLPPPTAELRAIEVMLNDPARAIDLRIFENMRVPPRSVISRVFADGLLEDEAIEDLSWWETTDSGPLPARAVTVRARRTFDGVEALILLRD